MSNTTQLENLASLISDKLNIVIGKVNEHTSGKADLSGARFTGEVSFDTIEGDVVPSIDSSFNLGSPTNKWGEVYTDTLSVGNILDVNKVGDDVVFTNNLTEGVRILNGGAVRINNSYTLPVVDGTMGQVMTTDGQGNVTFSNVEVESSDFAQYVLSHDFVTDGTNKEYEVEATTLNKVIFVEINGIIQKEGMDYTVSGKKIIFDEVPRSGLSGTVSFWGNDVSSVISTTDIIGDGNTLSFTTDVNLNKVVFVEVNGFVQKKGVDYTVNTINNSITFTESIPSEVSGTIVHV